MTGGNREQLLGRIREALRIPAPRPAAHSSRDVSSPAGERKTIRDCLPAVPADFAGRLALFREKSIQLKTEFYVVESPAAAATTVAGLRDRYAWTSAAAHRHPMIDPVIRSLELETLLVEDRPERYSFERCSVGITACDALIAQTGSILLTSRSAGGRALSVLPPHHVVLATAGQLLPDLSEAFELLRSKYGDRYPSFVGFITGPSRTGDIERILVLGAHGPRNLTVILVAGS